MLAGSWGPMVSCLISTVSSAAHFLCVTAEVTELCASGVSCNNRLFTHIFHLTDMTIVL